MPHRFNCHSHIFNYTCMPKRILSNFIDEGIANAVGAIINTSVGRWTLPKLMSLIPFGAKRYAQFLAIGLQKTQREVFETLQKNYNNEWKYILLTVDFDFMDTEKPDKDFITQIIELKDVKKAFPDETLAFLSIDPRRFSTDQEVVNFLEEYFPTDASKDNYRLFAGIKLYPRLGFYPYHPRLKPVYEFAVANELPITTHTNRNGGTYQIKPLEAIDFQTNSFNYQPDMANNSVVRQEVARNVFESTSQKSKNKVVSNFFMEPYAFVEVLNAFPELKINFAHFGGDKEIINQPTNDNWYYAIKDFMRRYPNVYTDVSYSLFNKKTFDFFHDDLKNNELKNKILFGTDFFMLEAEGDEDEFVNVFMNKFSTQELNLLCTENPKRFLKSKFLNI